MIDFRFSPGSKETLDRLAKLGDPTQFRGRLVAATARRAPEAAGYVIKNFPLRTRTGGLKRSIAGVSRLRNDVPELAVGIYKGPSLDYAAVQELGTKDKAPDSPFGPIRPKPGHQFLAVPTDDGGAKTPAGVARFKSARDFPDKLIFRRGKIQGLLGGKTVTAGAGLFKEGQTAPVYLLLRKVSIPAGRFLSTPFDTYVSTVLEQSILNDLSELISGPGPK